jgi:bacterioferritin-associated ferredoxin
MIFCSCKAVRQSEVIAHLSKLNPCLPLADLGAKTGATTDCGTCKDSVRDMMAKFEGNEARRSAAARIHAGERDVVFYSDFKGALAGRDGLDPFLPDDAGLEDNLAALRRHGARFYSVISIEGSLQEAREMAPHLEGVNLFALALDRGRRLFVNESGASAPEWIASLGDADVFQPWERINEGRFKKWNPAKIDRKALLRFLLSEITFVRSALKVPPLKAAISMGPRHSDFVSFPREINGVTNYRLLTDDKAGSLAPEDGGGERSMILSANALAAGIDEVMRSVDAGAA